MNSTYISMYVDWHPSRERCVLPDSRDENVDVTYVGPQIQRLLRIAP